MARKPEGSGIKNKHYAEVRCRQPFGLGIEHLFKPGLFYILEYNRWHSNHARRHYHNSGECSKVYPKQKTKRRMKKEFIQELIGHASPGIMAASFVFACIGILFVLLMGITVRDVKSTESPVQFSWNYLFCDNNKRIMSGLLAVIVSIRFAPDIFNFELKAWHGFMIGTVWDSLAFFIKQRTNILDPKK